MDNCRIIWKEGLFLQPQHFQQSENFILNNVKSLFSYSIPYIYGIVELGIEEASLANGTLTITDCKVVLPDGSIICVPNGISIHLTRSFESHFNYEKQSLDVFLAVPLISEGKCNVEKADCGSGTNSRYISRSISFTDEVHGMQKKDLEVGFYNTRLIFDDESIDNYSTLQICRLIKDQDGNVKIDDKFVPTLLKIGSSTYVMNMLRNLIELLYAKCDLFSQGRIHTEQGLAKFSKNEDGSFRMLQTISAYIPMLNYYYTSSFIHPFELYKHLMMLAGAISVFSADTSIRDFPKYDHHNISNTFYNLIQTIKRILESDFTTGCIQLPIEQINQSTYVCNITNNKLLGKSKFFMGVYSSIPSKELIVGILQRIKMSSRDRLEILISSAMPGLQLIHTQNPPGGLAIKPGFVYFSLDQQSQLWKSIESANSLAFYFPNNYPDLKIEMLALRE